jgi:putative phosphoribosyl transferase
MDAAPGRFCDRADAGRRLAAHLGEYASRDDVLVLALPRGGVPVASEVAAALGAPLDVFLVRKLGVPGQRELAMGAIATGGVRVLDERVVAAHDLSPETIASVAAHEQRELERRERLYRKGQPPPELRGRTVVLVDDGLATGSSMRAAVAAVRAGEPAAVVVAVPVAPPETCEALSAEADRVVCVLTPEPFYAVGVWYERFEQTSDEEIAEILSRARGEDA